MSASDDHQWYIEEITATEQVKDPVDVAGGHPAESADSEAETAPKASVTNDNGTSAGGTVDTPLSKVKHGFEAQPTLSCAQSRRSPRETWSCKTIGASSSIRPPYPRGGCSWTKVGPRYLLFGGADTSQQHFADIHSFNAASGKWEETAVIGSPPSPRSGHSAVAFGESLVIYGGMNGQDGVTFNDLYELRPGSAESADFMEWVALPAADMPPRNSHAAVLDGDTMIIIGGASPEGQTDEIFAVSLSRSSHLSCEEVSCKPDQSRATERRDSDGIRAGLPTAREMHSACVCNLKETKEASATKILVMGGRSAKGVLRDLFSLDTGSWTWTRLQDAPVARCAHSACFVDSAGIMAIYGGWDGGTTVANDLHLYHMRYGGWTTPQICPQPVGRFAHVACAVVEGGLLVFGGVNPGEDLEDVVLLSPA
ncbi:unnamed protein product [Hapterophycus canaliculatus]